MNRIDPDGRIDRWATFKASLGLVISGYAITAGFTGMVASGSIAAGTEGSATLAVVGPFLKSYALFSFGIAGFGESLRSLDLALETPDGMTAEEFSMIKELIKGFGGGELTQEAAKMITGIMGLKGMSKITDEGLLFLVEKLYNAGKSADDIINFLIELEKAQTIKQEEEDENKKGKKGEKEEEN